MRPCKNTIVLDDWVDSQVSANGREIVLDQWKDGRPQKRVKLRIEDDLLPYLARTIRTAINRRKARMAELYEQMDRFSKHDDK